MFRMSNEDKFNQLLTDYRAKWGQLVPHMSFAFQHDENTKDILCFLYDYADVLHLAKVERPSAFAMLTTRKKFLEEVFNVIVPYTQDVPNQQRAMFAETMGQVAAAQTETAAWVQKLQHETPINILTCLREKIGDKEINPHGHMHAILTVINEKTGLDYYALLQPTITANTKN